jgi:hypothetical protein
LIVIHSNKQPAVMMEQRQMIKAKARSIMFEVEAVPESSALIVAYSNHVQVESAVQELQNSGFYMNKLSIVGNDHHTEEHLVGYYNDGKRHWGKLAVFWNGLLLGAVFFTVPDRGPVLVAGPLASWIIAALEGTAVVGGVSAIGAGLCSIGIPKDSVLKYETALKASQFLLLVHGTAEEVANARSILERTNPVKMSMHPGARPQDWQSEVLLPARWR